MSQQRLGFSKLDGEPVHSGSSPNRRIPPEVLSEIFSLCLPTNGLPRPNPFEAPLLLCQICSSFRTVALSSPKLWASISIIRNRARDEDALMLDMWIERSGPYTLSFALTYRESGGNIDKLIKQLAPHSSRWKDVTVRFAGDRVPLYFLEAMSRGTSALEKLNIQSFGTVPLFPNGTVPRYSNGRMLNVSLAHNLKEITIDFQNNLQLDFGTAVLDKVKKVSFIGHCYVWIHAQLIFDCLEHCPAIEKFASEGSAIDGNHPENVKPLTLPSLEDFIMNATFGNPYPIFDLLHLPSLVTFTLICNTVPENLNSIVNLLKRSGGHIENLTITGNDTYVLANHIIDCLEQAPRLKHLACNFGMGLVAQVLRTNRVCAELASITLSADENTDLSLMGEMIFSRWFIPQSNEGSDIGLGGGRRLERVTICGGIPRKDLVEIPAIALCVAEGFELRCDRGRSSIFG
ncbi:hypothetical protein BD410DRAFT_783530 [Rickenella mellea]|uniref:Uncharacterized protein n=1 Tax=Rickenella mellea TaxID=50990 RepID=A0A4Y7QFR1_9AGAM|nr:hypothetical protein BD410DRAFT_783530 [Rickenella mellea]